MGIQDDFQTLLQTAETNLKADIDQIRYDLARKRFTKTPNGVELFLEQSADLLLNEISRALNEIKAQIYTVKEWEQIRVILGEFIETQYDSFLDFLVNNWEQPADQVNSHLLILKSSCYKESNLYIDRQKAKLSQGEQISKDILKIVYYGLAAGIVAFLIKFFLSR